MCFFLRSITAQVMLLIEIFYYLFFKIYWHTGIPLKDDYPYYKITWTPLVYWGWYWLATVIILKHEEKRRVTTCFQWKLCIFPINQNFSSFPPEVSSNSQTNQPKWRIFHVKISQISSSNSSTLLFISDFSLIPQ